MQSMSNHILTLPRAITRFKQTCLMFPWQFEHSLLCNIHTVLTSSKTFLSARSSRSCYETPILRKGHNSRGKLNSLQHKPIRRQTTETARRKKPQPPDAISSLISERPLSYPRTPNIYLCVTGSFTFYIASYKTTAPTSVRPVIG